MVIVGYTNAAKSTQYNSIDTEKAYAADQLKAKHEIRISALFKQLPFPLLKMVVVHELAHLREKDHNKAFYQLCQHMEPQYHQLEFDLRLFLTLRQLDGKAV